MKWEDVLAKKVSPPFTPYISDDGDVGNFSEEFTNLAPVDSPAQPPAKHAEIFRVHRNLCKLQCLIHLTCMGPLKCVLIKGLVPTPINCQLSHQWYFMDPRSYSGTSDKGPSEKGTISH